MACVTVKHFTEAFRRRDARNEGKLTIDYNTFVSRHGCLTMPPFGLMYAGCVTDGPRDRRSGVEKDAYSGRSGFVVLSIYARWDLICPHIPIYPFIFTSLGRHNSGHVATECPRFLLSLGLPVRRFGKRNGSVCKPS